MKRCCLMIAFWLSFGAFSQNPPAPCCDDYGTSADEANIIQQMRFGSIQDAVDAIAQAKNSKADVYITSDLKYHDFYQAENCILLCDIGHYESEQYTKSLLYEFLSKKLPNFAIVLSGINTNPVNYF